MKSFNYDGLDLVYKQDGRLISLAEVLLLDTYRSDLVKRDDTVVQASAISLSLRQERLDPMERSLLLNAPEESLDNWYIRQA